MLNEINDKTGLFWSTQRLFSKK